MVGPLIIISSNVLSEAGTVLVWESVANVPLKVFFTYRLSLLTIYLQSKFQKICMWEIFGTNVLKGHSTFIQSGSIHSDLKMYSFVHEAGGPQFITSCVANRAVPNILG